MIFLLGSEAFMKKKIFTIIQILLIVLFIINFGLFTYFVYKIDLIPTKYLYIGLLIVFFFLILSLFLLLKFKSMILKILGVLVIFSLTIGSFLGTKYLMNTYDFFRSIKKEKDVLIYSVIVLKDKEYKNIKDLQDKTLLYLEDEHSESVRTVLNEKISYREELDSEFSNLFHKLLENVVEAIVVEESYVSLAKDEIENFENRTQVIDTFEIQIDAYEETDEKVDITLNPFILYISGIDQYGNVSSVRGRSDVNQLLVVNPKTHRILIVNTPRDYYVQLAGTNGIKDKLTHAGVYGIEKSIKTLENFYDIDISYYLRVNFNTLVKIVDIIGGIDVISDKSFRSSHIRDWYVEKGVNHMDGAKALAYSRERYAYATGDHHRGANQQQVITAIIDKITSSTVLINKYESILKALEGSFQTDMSLKEMTSFIKYQIDKMPSWKIESYAVTGSGAMEPTYSMGANLKLYVMNPDMKSVNQAKQKINEVLNEE